MDNVGRMSEAAGGKHRRLPADASYFALLAARLAATACLPLALAQHGLITLAISAQRPTTLNLPPARSD